MVFLGLFIFFIFLFAYLRKKTTKNQQNAEEQFWAREYAANNASRQDISNLPYISIPLDEFPIGVLGDAKSRELEQTLQTLSERRILNLGNQTNTDLKLAYGPSNLNILMDCDQNFVQLCRTLVSYAECLLAAEHTSEARTVLEFGIQCGSDISKNFLLLAELYKNDGNTDALEALLDTASNLDSPMKASIVKRLQELQN